MNDVLRVGSHVHIYEHQLTVHHSCHFFIVTVKDSNLRTQFTKLDNKELSQLLVNLKFSVITTPPCSLNFPKLVLRFTEKSLYHKKIN